VDSMKALVRPTIDGGHEDTCHKTTTCIANSCASLAHQGKSQYLNFPKCCNITSFTTAGYWSTHMSTGVNNIDRKLCHMGMIVELTQATDQQRAETLIVNSST
jgi:hypothetical protein